MSRISAGKLVERLLGRLGDSLNTFPCGLCGIGTLAVKFLKDISIRNFS